MDILLYDTGPLPGGTGLFDNLPYLFEVLGHHYPIAPVRVLPRLQYPNILLGLADDNRLLLFVVRSRLALLEALLLLDLLFLFVVVGFEPDELGILEALFHVEGDGDGREDILVHGFVVVAHVDEEGLLVAQVEVVLQFVVQLHIQLGRHQLLLLLLLLLLFDLLLGHLGELLLVFLLGGILQGEGGGLHQLGLLLLCVFATGHSGCVDFVVGGGGCYPYVGLLVHKLAAECVHDGVLPQLRPHEVHFFDLLLVVQQPPEPCLE